MQTMLHHLDNNPSVKQALEEEVASIWDGKAPITRALLRKLHKCRAFSLESMRIVPPVNVVSRKLEHDAEVDVFSLPKGTTVSLGIKSITDHMYYGDSEELRLDRYLDTNG